jgi:hypothetical protein
MVIEETSEKLKSKTGAEIQAAKQAYCIIQCEL